MNDACEFIAGRHRTVVKKLKKKGKNVENDYWN
jgi:hypothetical protein